MIPEKTEKEIYETPKSEGEGSAGSSGSPVLNAWFGSVKKAYLDELNSTLYMNFYNNIPQKEYVLSEELLVSKLDEPYKVLGSATKLVFYPTSIPENAKVITDGECHILIHPTYG